jgi:hypothetical protein
VIDVLWAAQRHGDTKDRNQEASLRRTAAFFHVFALTFP